MYPDRAIGWITEQRCFDSHQRQCQLSSAEHASGPWGSTKRAQTAATFGHLLQRSRSSGSSSVPVSCPYYEHHYQSQSQSQSGLISQHRPHYCLFAFVSDRQKGKSDSSQNSITRSGPTLNTKRTAPAAAARPHGALHEHALVSANFLLQQNCGTVGWPTLCTVHCTLCTVHCHPQ